MKHFLIGAVFVVIFIAISMVLPITLSAKEAGPPSREAGPSAMLIDNIAKPADLRVKKLEEYLASHNSPLAPYAKAFVDNADKYGLDWRLVASISGVESTFGKHLPYNSYNAYGWNGGNYYFKNWEDGIETVSKTLRQNYMNKWEAKTVYDIAPIYAPPSKTWAYNVNYFMNMIEKGPKNRPIALELKLTI